MSREWSRLLCSVGRGSSARSTQLGVAPAEFDAVLLPACLPMVQPRASTAQRSCPQVGSVQWVAGVGGGRSLDLSAAPSTCLPACTDSCVARQLPPPPPLLTGEKSAITRAVNENREIKFLGAWKLLSCNRSSASQPHPAQPHPPTTTNLNHHICAEEHPEKKQAAEAYEAVRRQGLSEGARGDGDGTLQEAAAAVLSKSRRRRSRQHADGT